MRPCLGRAQLSGVTFTDESFQHGRQNLFEPVKTGFQFVWRQQTAAGALSEEDSLESLPEVLVEDGVDDRVQRWVAVPEPKCKREAPALVQRLTAFYGRILQMFKLEHLSLARFSSLV
jgi:hypothetical protein